MQARDLSKTSHIFILQIKRRILGFVSHALDEDRQFQLMVVAPHARFAVGNLTAGWDMIPVIGPMVDAVQKQALMVRLGGEIRLIKQCPGHRESGLRIALALGTKIVAQTDQTLCSNR